MALFGYESPSKRKFSLTTKEFEELLHGCGFEDFEKVVFEERWRGKTNGEISSLANCSLSTVNRTVKNIKKKIEKYLTQERH